MRFNWSEADSDLCGQTSGFTLLGLDLESVCASVWAEPHTFTLELMSLTALWSVH